MFGWWEVQPPRQIGTAHFAYEVRITADNKPRLPQLLKRRTWGRHLSTARTLAIVKRAVRLNPWHCRRHLHRAVPLVVPWGSAATVTTVCVLVAIVATAGPVLRGRRAA